MEEGLKDFKGGRVWGIHSTDVVGNDMSLHPYVVCFFWALLLLISFFLFFPRHLSFNFLFFFSLYEAFSHHPCSFFLFS